MLGLARLIPTRSSWSLRVITSGALAVLLAAATIGPVSGATVTTTWNARIGSGGLNGSSRIEAYATGSGALKLKLVKLRASASLPVVVVKGTCSSPGPALLTVPSIRTTSTGAATRTSTLSAAQIKLVRAATKGTGKIAIRIGSGSSRKCGNFVVATPPAPPATVAATITVGAYPQGAALDTSSVWVVNSGEDTISRIDARTNLVLSTIPVDLSATQFLSAVTVGFGALWVTVLGYDASLVDEVGGVVLRIDPVSGSTIGNPIPVGRGAYNVAASTDAVWVSNALDGTLTRIDAYAGQVVATIQTGGFPDGIVAGFGSIWVANQADGKVARVDPATNQVVASVQTQLDAAGIAIGGGSVWVANYGETRQPGGMVSRIDPATNAVTAVVPVGINPGYIAWGGGYLWVAMVGEPTVVQLDPAKNSVKARLAVGAENWGIVAADHAVWVVQPTAAGADPTLLKPGTVTRINF
jgi:YVTN family beta-propeller protein